jgi:hypothetical protein
LRARALGLSPAGWILSSRHAGDSSIPAPISLVA